MSTSHYGEYIYNKMPRPRKLSDEERTQKKHERDLIYRKEYNKKYMNGYLKKRKKSDLLFKLAFNFRCRISSALKSSGVKKNTKTSIMLGCTYEELRQHLESQFESWMSWDNWGGEVVLEQNVSWDIDHIIPLNSAVTEEDIIRLNHYTNLRPLCSYYNRHIKRDKI